MTDYGQAELDRWDLVIRRIATQIGRPVPDDCRVRLLPLQEINAVARMLPGGEYEIGVNAGLFQFVTSVTGICARTDRISINAA